MKIFKYLYFLLLPAFMLPQSAIIDTTFSSPSLVDSIRSYSVDYKSIEGTVQLATGENENLALNKYAYLTYAGAEPTDTARKNPLRLIDGSKVSPSFVFFPSENTGGKPGSYVIIDLQAVRRVKRVIFYSLGGNPDTRIRAFTIYAGMDTSGIGMDKVYQEANNLVANPEAIFNAITARYVKITIDVVFPTFSTVISEIEVYGEGFLPVGEFVSSVRKLQKRVNFGTFEYEGDVPSGTQVFYSVRTGNSPTIDTSWSLWSDSSSISNTLYTVYEPREYVQYRLRLQTSTLESPQIHKVKLNYDTVNVADFTEAAVSPRYAQILKEQVFTLGINLKFQPDDTGIDTLTVFTPSPSEFEELLVNGVKQSVNVQIFFNKIIITLTNTLKTDANLEIRIRTTPYLAVNPFTTFINSKLKHNPQRVDTKISDGSDNWSIITTGVPEKLIIGGKASPNPFTPNGDGKNDVTKIEFFVGNLAQPVSILGKELRKLSIKIYDLNGRLIKSLVDDYTGANAYIVDNGIEWDGRDDGGKIVRPGVYVYQIRLDTDNGGEYLSKTVVVAY